MPVNPSRSSPLWPPAILRAPATDASEVREHATDLAVEEGTGVGEFDAAGGAGEQLHPEVGLQSADGLGEGGLGEVQPFGRPAEVAQVGDRFEVAQLAQVHSVNSLRV